MKSYQKAQKPVKESVKILDEQALLETAAEGLLSLSVELGMQYVSCWRPMLRHWLEKKAGMTAAAWRIGTEVSVRKSSWAVKNATSNVRGCAAKKVPS